MTKKTNPEKAKKHTEKGDRHFAKGKIDKALKEYRKALELDPENAEIYDKLTNAHNETKHEWDMKDFADSVSWIMKKQELNEPQIRQVHAALSPEWKKAQTLAFEILNLDDEKIIHSKIEELISMGEVATRAIIGMLLEIKKQSTDNQ